MAYRLTSLGIARCDGQPWTAPAQVVGDASRSGRRNGALRSNQETFGGGDREQPRSSDRGCQRVAATRDSHEVPRATTALAKIRSFRVQATSATLCSFPAAI